MAVEDKYVNANITGNNIDKSWRGINTGAKMGVMVSTVEIAAADDDGSKYRMFKNVPGDYIPVDIKVACDAITAGTDFELGLYKPDLGAVISKGVFMTNQTLASAVDFGNATALDGMDAVDIADYGVKRIFEYAGHTITNKLPCYDIVLTGDTVGTAAGTVTVIIYYAQD